MLSLKNMMFTTTLSPFISLLNIFVICGYNHIFVRISRGPGKSIFGVAYVNNIGGVGYAILLFIRNGQSKKV